MNYFVTYDLNGAHPTHAEMDQHLKKLGRVGRVLETVWYVRYGGTTEQLFNYANAILSPNDRLIVIDAKNAMMRNLLIPNSAIQQAWAA